MKILVIQNGWSGQGISGGDKHLLDVFGYWPNRREINFLAPPSGSKFLRENFGAEIKGLNLVPGWEILPLSRLNSLAKILIAYFQRLVLTTIQLVISVRFDLAVASSHFLYDLGPAVVLRIFKGSRVVVYIYHLVSFQQRGRGPQNNLSVLVESLSLSLVKKFADVVFTDNRETLNQLKSLGINEAKIFKTAVGIKRPELEPAVTLEFDLCFSGRLVKSKGVYDLIKALFEIKKIRPLVKLIMMGTGGELENLVELRKELNLEGNLELKGFVAEDKKFEILKKSRIFVSPSYEEGWGISLAEALACGLPAVVYDLTALRDVFANGPIFCPLGSVSSLAAAVIRLLQDKGFYNRKSGESTRCVESYYLDEVAPWEISILSRL